MTGLATEGMDALHGVGKGAEEAAMELLDVLFLWIVPLITLIVGYLMSPAIGLSGAVGTLIDGVLGSLGVAQHVMASVAGLVAVVIWGTIAGTAWSLSKKIGSKYSRWILRPVATLFGGFAIGEVPALAAGKVNNGSLGKLAVSFPGA